MEGESEDTSQSKQGVSAVARYIGEYEGAIEQAVEYIQKKHKVFFEKRTTYLIWI